MEPPALDKARRRDPSAKLDAGEVTEVRSCLGSIGWLARQTRPDLAFSCSIIAQAMGAPAVSHMMMAYKLAQQAVKYKHGQLIFRPSLELDLWTCKVAVFADSSHANVDCEKLGEKVKSQCGYVCALVSPDFTDGKKHSLHVLEWHSGSIKRVVRSTLAAEANGLTEGAEAALWLRAVLGEIRGEKHDELTDTIWITDAKSLRDVLVRDAGRASDKRVRIIVAALRQMLEEDGIEVVWCDTAVMLADILTKECGSEIIDLVHDVLRTNEFSIEQPATSKVAKVRASEQRRARKDARAQD